MTTAPLTVPAPKKRLVRGQWQITRRGLRLSVQYSPSTAELTHPDPRVRAVALILAAGVRR